MNKKRGIKRHPKPSAAPVENNGTKVAIGPVNYSATGSGSARTFPHGSHQHQPTSEATDQRHSQQIQSIDKRINWITPALPSPGTTRQQP